MEKMKPRISIVTLGVRDLAKATAFYQAVFGVERSSKSSDDISFFTLPGTWLGLYPLDKLAEDIGPAIALPQPGFHGFSLAQNVPAREGVAALLDRARAAGGTVVKPAQDTFWGGHSGYFTDLDGYYWEVAWAPMFQFAADGSLVIPD
jgi:catechol 2,3-dioxygenase-like lactoylglutathione lyase family enzyme